MPRKGPGAAVSDRAGAGRRLAKPAACRLIRRQRSARAARGGARLQGLVDRPARRCRKPRGVDPAAAAIPSAGGIATARAGPHRRYRRPPPREPLFRAWTGVLRQRADRALDDGAGPASVDQGHLAEIGRRIRRRKGPRPPRDRPRPERPGARAGNGGPGRGPGADHRAARPRPRQRAHLGRLVRADARRPVRAAGRGGARHRHADRGPPVAPGRGTLRGARARSRPRRRSST